MGQPTKTIKQPSNEAIGKQHEGFMAKSLLARDSQRVSETRRRGRGSTINPTGRFEALARDVFDDGWDTIDELPPFETSVQSEKAKTIITRNESPDLPFDRSINPYRGCEHGCTYCYARPTHAHMGHSAGLDFETRLYAKPNAAELLKRELGRKNYQVKPLAMGTNTDPYQPIERDWAITRSILEVLSAANHPVTIVTKSALIRRDIDILSPMAAKGLVSVTLSLTTLDRRLSRAMEPRTSAPGLRLKAIRELTDAGIPTSVLVAPVIPALNDHEIERILDSAKNAGAASANHILLRLPLEVSPLFREWLLRHYPDRYRHVMNLLRSMRGGKDYDPEYGKRMAGTGPYAWQIKRRFDIARNRLGLAKRELNLDCSQFCAPKSGEEQLQLF